MSILFFPPRFKATDIANVPVPGAFVTFYATGTSTLQPVYADAASADAADGSSVQLTNPVKADGNGLFPAIYGDDSLPLYKVVFQYPDVANPDIPGALLPLGTIDPYNTTPASLAPRFDPIESEITSGLTIVNDIYEPGNVLRYGILPNDESVKALNDSYLKTLLSPALSVTGFVGRVYFPNTTGADVYHLSDMIQVRDGVRLDLNGSTLNFSKTFAAADSFMGFLNLIRDVSIVNGNITVDYNGTGGTNAGPVMRIGSRASYPFGAYPGGVEDEDLTVPMGNITIRNVRIITNNPAAAPILMLGGLDGVVMENVFIDGQAVAPKGIYYEFGFYHYEATNANVRTSHALNMQFTNIHINNLSTTVGQAFSLVGALNAKVDGLHIDGTFNAVVCRSGEAMYYLKGTPYVAILPRIELSDINGKNVASGGIYLQGAEVVNSGALHYAEITALGHPGDYDAQTDLIAFSIDGFSISAAGYGMRLSSPCLVQNGALYGTSASGQLIIEDECVQFEIKNVKIVNSSSVGIRANFGGSSAIWSPARKKIGAIRNCQVAGNTGSGIAIANSESILIENCRIGYNTLYDVAAEATQTHGVALDATGNGVICRGNYVTCSGAGNAYNNPSGASSLSISHPRGTVTINSSVPYDRNMIAIATATQIADIASVVNTVGKYAGRQAYDTSNNRMMTATGTNANSTWKEPDDSGTSPITPA